MPKTIVPNKLPLVDSSPRLAFVGEAPGEHEEIRGEPFVGPSGWELDKLLAKHKIPRSGSFLGNVHQYRPPQNKIDLVDRKSPEWREGVEKLRLELGAFNPDLTIALGDIPLQILCGVKGITKWRGSILPNILIGKGKVLPTFHPAYFLRNWKERVVVDFDIGKAKRLSETKDFALPNRKFVVQPSFSEALSILKSFQNVPKLSVDFENHVGDGRPKCLGFAPSKDFAISIPMPGYCNWTTQEHKEIWREIASLIKNPQIGKIFHNAIHDLLVFAVWMRIVPRNVCMDTMLGWHNCYPELPKSLAFTASILTNQPYWKSMHKDSDEEEDEKSWSDKVPFDKLCQYNCTDCVVTYEVAEELEKEIDDWQVREGFERDMAMIPISLGMTYSGIKVNLDKCSLGYADLQARIDDTEAVLSGLYQGINTKSHKQMAELLYDKLGLPPIKIKDKKTGFLKVTTNEDALLELNRKYSVPQLTILLKNRQLRTQQGFYDLPFGKDGRIHPQWKIASTETFRWAGGECFLGGRSLMNIPDERREVYEADPGFTFIKWDKRQAEARFVAYKGFICTGNDYYKRLIESGEKVHNWFLIKLSERGICPLDPRETRQQIMAAAEVRNQTFKDWYYIAKQSIHALSYDMAGRRFSKQVYKNSHGEIYVPEKQANEIKAALYEDIPTIPAWQKAVKKFLADNRIMETCFGRKRMFLERVGDELFREGYAHEPQATASGDDVVRSMLACYEAFPQIRINHNNYDSMMCQAPEGEALEIATKMKPLCEQTLRIWNFQKTDSIEITIPIDIAIGKNWSDASPENPDGLREIKV